MLLPFLGPNQVDTFLHEHEGAGIQHVGLHTDDIIKTTSSLSDNGVQFAEPPYTYYTEVYSFLVQFKDKKPAEFYRYKCC